MELNRRINAFTELGSILRDALREKPGRYLSEIEELIMRQETLNPWFTPGNVRMAIEAIAVKLTEENLVAWTNRYPSLREKNDISTVAVIMAGNIPLVGFHDFLSVLISGNRIVAKTSSKDSELMKFIGNMLIETEPEFAEKMEFTDGILEGFDKVIATGSDNSSRYFEYYFGKYPHIIRKNRSSVAVLIGDETEDDLRELGKDVFSYFGLGCRNVSKIYIPRGFNPERLKEAWSAYSGTISHSKYANNYDYNKAVWLVNREKFTDTGYLLLKEDISLSSPVAAVYYEHYESASALSHTLSALAERIQCITGKGHVPFGSAQLPELWDYSDNIDTLDFLLKKNMPGIS